MTLFLQLLIDRSIQGDLRDQELICQRCYSRYFTFHDDDYSIAVAIRNYQLTAYLLAVVAIGGLAFTSFHEQSPEFFQICTYVLRNIKELKPDASRIRVSAARC